MLEALPVDTFERRLERRELNHVAFRIVRAKAPRFGRFATAPRRSLHLLLLLEFDHFLEVKRSRSWLGIRIFLLDLAGLFTRSDIELSKPTPQLGQSPRLQQIFCFYSLWIDLDIGFGVVYRLRGVAGTRVTGGREIF